MDIHVIKFNVSGFVAPNLLVDHNKRPFLFNEKTKLLFAQIVD